MKVALEANSTEDEHDCFSDDTHHTLFFNGKSIRNIYLGEYKRIDGSVVRARAWPTWSPRPTPPPTTP